MKAQIGVTFSSIQTTACQEHAIFFTNLDLSFGSQRATPVPEKRVPTLFYQLENHQHRVGLPQNLPTSHCASKHCVVPSNMSLPASKYAFVYIEHILNVYMHPNPEIQETERQRRRKDRLKLPNGSLPFPILFPNRPPTMTTRSPHSPCPHAQSRKCSVAECNPAGP